jgi:hypothetical protein
LISLIRKQAQARIDRLALEVSRLEAALETARQPKKRNGTKKGQGDLTAKLQAIARMFDHIAPEMKKLGRAKLDELILDLQS